MKLYYNADISALNAVLNSFDLDIKRVRFDNIFVSSLALKVAEYIKISYLDINQVTSGNIDDSNAIINDEFSEEDFIYDYYNEVIFGYASLLVHEFDNPQHHNFDIDLYNELYGADTPYEDQRDSYVADLIYDIVTHIHKVIGKKYVVSMKIINVYDTRILYEICTD